MDTARTGEAWVGWFRSGPRHKWIQLVFGPSYDDTVNLLLNALANVKGGNRLVMPAGQHPDRLSAGGSGRRRL
jgi:hypothetical protein